MKKGLSFVELLVSLIILSIAILSLLWLNSFSNRQVVDTSTRLLTMQLAEEALEVCHTLGYQALNDWISGKREITFLSRVWTDIPEIVPQNPALRRPIDACRFQRRIDLQHIESPGMNAIHVQVRVRHNQGGWLKGLLPHSALLLEDVVLETIP